MRILKFERKVTGQVEEMLSHWRKQSVKIKAYLSQRFSTAEQEVTGKVPDQMAWCGQKKRIARRVASIQYYDNKSLSV